MDPRPRASGSGGGDTDACPGLAASASPGTLFAMQTLTLPRPPAPKSAFKKIPRWLLCLPEFEKCWFSPSAPWSSDPTSRVSSSLCTCS